MYICTKKIIFVYLYIFMYILIQLLKSRGQLCCFYPRKLGKLKCFVRGQNVDSTSLRLSIIIIVIIIIFFLFPRDFKKKHIYVEVNLCIFIVWLWFCIWRARFYVGGVSSAKKIFYSDVQLWKPNTVSAATFNLQRSNKAKWLEFCCGRQMSFHPCSHRGFRLKKRASLYSEKYCLKFGIEN